MLSYEPDHTILYTRKVWGQAEVSVVEEFNAMLELLGIVNDFDVTVRLITNKASGSKIRFMGLTSQRKDNTGRMKSIANLSTWVIDEFEDLAEDEELFNRANLSIRKVGVPNRIIMIQNPTTREFWAYNKFFVRNDVEEKMGQWTDTVNNTTFIHTTYLENIRNLDSTFIDEAEQTKKFDIKEYNHLFLGGWLESAKGVVFDKGINWIEGEYKHTKQKPYVGVDFGYTDPTAAVEGSLHNEPFIGDGVAIADGGNGGALNKAYKGKWYIRELFYETGLNAEATVQKLYPCTNITDGYGDPVRLTCIGDSEDASKIDSLRKANISIYPCKKGPGSVYHGITIVKDYLLIVEPTAKNIKRDLHNHQWEDDKANTPKNEYKHAPDAIRYMIYYAVGTKRSNDVTRIKQRR